MNNSTQQPSNQCDVSTSEPTSYVVEGATYRKLIADRDAYRTIANDLARQLRERTPADTNAPPERASHEPEPDESDEDTCRLAFQAWANDLGLCLDEIFMSSDGVPEHPYEDNDTNQFWRAWLASWKAKRAAKPPAVKPCGWVYMQTYVPGPNSPGPNWSPVYAEPWQPGDGVPELLHALEVLRQRWSHNVNFEATLGACKEEIELCSARATSTKESAR